VIEQVVWTSVFADGPGGGNPCPVVFGAEGWTPEQMQRRAGQFGAETVFVLPAEHGGDVRYRYFVPRHEMEMCVHATIAATVVLGRDGRLAHSPATIETPLGPLRAVWDAEALTATVEQFAPQFGPVVTGAARLGVLAALGVSAAEIADGAAPIQSVSTARPKLLVPLLDERALDGLTPDFEALWTVCDELGVTGFYPFTLRATGADVAARQFPARAGYDEDPATGVAAGALGAYLAQRAGTAGWRRVQIAQGRAMGRPSLISAEALVASDGRVTATRVGGSMQNAPPDGRHL
jgi:trans-2,3-dihydro-3-hydroxyanthranilate isomerase